MCCTSSLRIVSSHSLFEASSTELKSLKGPRNDRSAGNERRDSGGAEVMGLPQGLFRTLRAVSNPASDGDGVGEGWDAGKGGLYGGV